MFSWFKGKKRELSWEDALVQSFSSADRWLKIGDNKYKDNITNAELLVTLKGHIYINDVIQSSYVSNAFYSMLMKPHEIESANKIKNLENLYRGLI